MKVFVKLDRPSSWGINRLTHYMEKYCPFELVDASWKADLVVLITTGKLNHAKRTAQEILDKNKQYAVFQISLQSTRNPDPKDWMELWNKAKVVWSYYDLPIKRNFYQSPLGADPDIFYPIKFDKTFDILTMGEDNAECLNEVFQTTQKIFHVNNLTDGALNIAYNHCRYVSALRHKGGFEMPAAEALLCGIKPIMFDLPDYRRWFDGLVLFIPEDENIITNLQKIFSNDSLVTESEIAEARKRFDWKTIIEGFWERCYD
jgi:glycosyltransferase involved in cell wall biosynthesis